MPRNSLFLLCHIFLFNRHFNILLYKTFFFSIIQCRLDNNDFVLIYLHTSSIQFEIFLLQINKMLHCIIFFLLSCFSFYHAELSVIPVKFPFDAFLLLTRVFQMNSPPPLHNLCRHHTLFCSSQHQSLRACHVRFWFKFLFLFSTVCLV